MVSPCASREPMAEPFRASSQRAPQRALNHPSRIGSRLLAEVNPQDVRPPCAQLVRDHVSWLPGCSLSAA
jgi:hypothetical protein